MMLAGTAPEAGLSGGALPPCAQLLFQVSAVLGSVVNHHSQHGRKAFLTKACQGHACCQSYPPLTYSSGEEFSVMSCIPSPHRHSWRLLAQHPRRRRPSATPRTATPSTVTRMVCAGPRTRPSRSTRRIKGTTSMTTSNTSNHMDPMAATWTRTAATTRTAHPRTALHRTMRRPRGARGAARPARTCTCCPRWCLAPGAPTPQAAPRCSWGSSCSSRAPSERTTAYGHTASQRRRCSRAPDTRRRCVWTSCHWRCLWRVVGRGVAIMPPDDTLETFAVGG